MNSIESVKNSENSLKEQINGQSELLLRSFSDHFSYHDKEIYDSLLEDPYKYINSYIKVVQALLSASKSEDKTSINITNNNYVAFFEEVSDLSRKLDSNTHKLTKNSAGQYEIIEL